MFWIGEDIPNISLSLFGGFRTIEYRDEVINTIDSLDMKSYINLYDHVLHRDIWGHLARHMVGIIPFNDFK